MMTSHDDAAEARRHALQAVEVMIDILRDRSVSQTDRNAAARALIAIGWIEPGVRPDDPAKLH